MAFSRGRYGIEYHPEPRGGEGHHFRWLFAVLFVVTIASLLVARGCRKRGIEPLIEPPPAQTRPGLGSDDGAKSRGREGGGPRKYGAKSQRPLERNASNASAAETTGAPTNAPAHRGQAQIGDEPPRTHRGAHIPPPATIAATNWLETARTRPTAEAALLARLADAERLGNKRIARDTLEKLRRSSAMADLDDPFARRLGALNAEILFSAERGERDGWTVPVVVKRGDSAQRLAREHGTTLAAVLKLNSLKDANRIRTGDTLRILEFPRATLVVHAGLRFADISLSGRFFKRYDVAIPKKPAAGSYPVTRDDGPTDRFASLGLKFSPQDREELALLLAPGSRIIVSPM